MVVLLLWPEDEQEREEQYGRRKGEQKETRAKEI